MFTFNQLIERQLRSKHPPHGENNPQQNDCQTIKNGDGDSDEYTEFPGLKMCIINEKLPIRVQEDNVLLPKGISVYYIVKPSSKH